MSTALDFQPDQLSDSRPACRLTGEGATDRGQVREVNEDAYCVEPWLGLAVVADGVGGGERGDIASRMAVETILQRYHDSVMGAEARGLEHLWLMDGIHAANKAIHELFSTGQTATTVVAGAFVEGGVHVAHVGDSRAFRLRSGELEQLTEDHSLVNVYLREGVITPEEADDFRLRNVLTRGVGHRDDVEVDWHFHPHRAGDRYVLCTDGVTDLLTNEQITAILLDYSDDDALAAEALCDAAWAAGGHDNITAVVVRPAGSGR
ncbi:MAG: protein phosphatase 2C domain-containing protein [Myxococcota bacterium]|nr:protein phosphatase 2C domain-containing protein [Myxococcota bacterium]